MLCSLRFLMSTEFNSPIRAIRPIRILLWAMAVIFVVPAAAMAQPFVVRWQARHFLQDIMRIRVGESDLGELQRLASKYRSFAVQDGPRCDQDLCSFDFYFGNRWLWRIGLASGTRFGGAITAQTGKITKIEVFLQTGISNSAQVVETPATPGSTPFRVTGKRATSEDTDYTVSKTIHLTTDASQAVRQKAYNFNLACLTALRGCNNAHLLLSGPGDHRETETRYSRD